MDKEQKVEGKFIAPQLKSSVNGPWLLFEREPPFASYLRRIFHPRKVRDEKEHTEYVTMLVDSKVQEDAIVYRRAYAILHDLRKMPRWLTWCHTKRAELIRRFRVFWPAFRKTVGF